MATVMAGRPLTIERDLPNCNALLYAFHPGTMGGPALSNLIFGLVGPNAMILALMASGFNGQSFAFHGYLPIKSPERQNAIKDLERRSMANNETELFIETPFRNNAMLQDLCKNLHPATRVCVACNLTCDDELI
ncbi:MAG: hypothetical protein IIT43_08620, partial [Clostridia bacterium]|nr:hypothetical protein [Clostridia bacterium]